MGNNSRDDGADGSDDKQHFIDQGTVDFVKIRFDKIDHDKNLRKTFLYG